MSPAATLADLPAPPDGRHGWPWTIDGQEREELAFPPEQTPGVTVVTPNLNQAAYLEEALRSVLLQDYPDLEYLVIDGGSRDGSVEVIRRYAPHLEYWTSEPDRGQSHALNKGLARATGEVVGWLNADDVYLPNTLKRVAMAFREDPELGLVYGDCLVLDERSGELRRWSGVGPPGCVALLVHGNGIPQPSAFVRRSVLERTGLLDESMHLAMDYDLWLRISKHTRARYLPEPLSVVRDHAATKTRRQAVEFVFEYVRAVDRFYAEPPVPAAARAVRNTAYARVYYACAEATGLRLRQPVQALGWFLRSLRHDPRLAFRAPRAMYKLLAAGRTGGA